VARAITRYQTALAAAGTNQAQIDAARTAGFRAVGRACRLAVQPHQTWSLLQRPDRADNLTAVVELCLDLVNIGTDHGGNQRSLYGDHAYAVIGFAAAMAGGAALPAPLPEGAARSTLILGLDPDASIVTLQNPHHTNEPDELGEGHPLRTGDGTPSGSGSDGVFTMSLQSFLRNVSRLDSAVFNRT
jgi:hypothetical protein